MEVNIQNNGITSLKDIDWEKICNMREGMMVHISVVDVIINGSGAIESLSCLNNKLTNLEGCPSTVKRLNCAYNNLIRVVLNVYASSSNNKTDNKSHQEDKEQYFCDLSRTRGNPTKAEQGGDQRDDKKYNGIMQHDASPFQKSKLMLQKWQC